MIPAVLFFFIADDDWKTRSIGSRVVSAWDRLERGFYLPSLLDGGERVFWVHEIRCHPIGIEIIVFLFLIAHCCF
jgi:hypothetical protein